MTAGPPALGLEPSLLVCCSVAALLVARIAGAVAAVATTDAPAAVAPALSVALGIFL